MFTNQQHELFFGGVKRCTAFPTPGENLLMNNFTHTVKIGYFGKKNFTLLLLWIFWRCHGLFCACWRGLTLPMNSYSVLSDACYFGLWSIPITSDFLLQPFILRPWNSFENQLYTQVSCNRGSIFVLCTMCTLHPSQEVTP